MFFWFGLRSSQPRWDARPFFKVTPWHKSLRNRNPKWRWRVRRPVPVTTPILDTLCRKTIMKKWVNKTLGTYNPIWIVVVVFSGLWCENKQDLKHTCIRIDFMNGQWCYTFDNIWYIFARHISIFPNSSKPRRANPKPGAIFSRDGWRTTWKWARRSEQSRQPPPFLPTKMSQRWDIRVLTVIVSLKDHSRWFLWVGFSWSLSLTSPNKFVFR